MTAKTIADIARLAGVSKSTVSRALNESPLIGVETKDRIRAIAAEHDFAMNQSARRLSRRQSNVVGLVLVDWPDYTKTLDLFMLEVMGGVSAGLGKLDYELLVLRVGPRDTDWVRRTLDSGRADGFIMHSPSCSPQILERIVKEQAPTVLWGSRVNGCSTVSGDSVVGGRLATEHLLATGRTRIAFVGGPSYGSEVQERRRGYEEALTAAGITVDPQLIEHADWMNAERTGAEAAAEILRRDPAIDGIVACSDFLALGAIEAVRASGRSVPEDVGVVGYDDVAIAAYSNPPLTTIRQDGTLIGTLLARALVQQLQTGALTNVTIPAELVVRESA
jgi:DNA-binding LacI/PurR family transcriptional regulator